VSSLQNSQHSLPASEATDPSYRQIFGETPKQTRLVTHLQKTCMACNNLSNTKNPAFQTHSQASQARIS
jgi:hypothetical protein